MMMLLDTGCSSHRTITGRLRDTSQEYHESTCPYDEAVMEEAYSGYENAPFCPIFTNLCGCARSIRSCRFGILVNCYL